MASSISQGRLKTGLMVICAICSSRRMRSAFRGVAIATVRTPSMTYSPMARAFFAISAGIFATASSK